MWQSGKVANVSHFGEAMVADLGGKEKSATSCVEIADAERLTNSSVQIASGPWPMQLVVPRAVRAAVRIDTMT